MPGSTAPARRLREIVILRMMTWLPERTLKELPATERWARRRSGCISERSRWDASHSREAAALAAHRAMRHRLAAASHALSLTADTHRKCLELYFFR
jgi:hypothetical protein